jgi:hypothetical protein
MAAQLRWQQELRLCANWQPATSSRLAVEGQWVAPGRQQGPALRRQSPATQPSLSVLCAAAGQGTLVYLPPSSCVGAAARCATAAQSARGRTGSWGTRPCVRVGVTTASPSEVSLLAMLQGSSSLAKQSGQGGLQWAALDSSKAGHCLLLCVLPWCQGAA